MIVRVELSTELIGYWTLNYYYYSVLDTVVISGDDIYCNVVFGTLVGVFVFSVMWSELLINLLLVVLCGHQWPSAREWSVRSHLR